jgi:hypothetical protein
MLTRVLLALVLACAAAGASLAQETTVVALGLTDHKVSEEELQGGAALPAPKFNTPGVAYSYVAHARQGDTVEVTLKKDGEPLMRNMRELDADEDGVLLMAGKTGVPAGGWPDGAYSAHVKVTRNGKDVAVKETDPIPFQ